VRVPDHARLRGAILAWYDAHRRHFPWQRSRDPYRVLVSEVMLQQTQAGRVIAAYPAFLRRFPTAEALAAAGSAEVLAAWSGLGYNRRALALQRAAARVAASGWPRDVAGLEALPGVGRYTARAVASLAFGEPVGVVDTNVRRWLTRRFGLRSDAPAAELQRLADTIATAGGDRRVAAWTHASMQFGAAVCRARAPSCPSCPIAQGCPSREAPRVVPVPRQRPFAGSDRARRGAVLRALVRAPDRSLPLADVLELLPAPDRDRIVDALEADGLVHRTGDRLRLGNADLPAPAATIDP
jgi:A/G-specific adenine glycosylase